MIRFLVRLAIYLGSAALALWVTSLVLVDFDVTFTGLVLTSAIFAVVQSAVGWLLHAMTHTYARVLGGGVGLVTAFVSLLVTTSLRSGLTITGFTTWILATLIVWLLTALAGWLLPLIFLRKGAKGRAHRD